MAENKTPKTDSTSKKVQHTFTAADGSGSSNSIPASAKPAAPAEGKAGAGKYRLIAILLWLAGIACEVVAILLIAGKIAWQPQLLWIIIALVVDLACVIIGSQLWKKANRLDPASEKNKLKFWLWNNMGVIASVIAFVPFIILTLTNKDADKKTKTIAAIVAVVALLIGGAASYDYNPISAEQKESMEAEYQGATVYWTKSGTVYHLDSECGHLNHSEELFYGDVDQAIEANKTRVCKDCEKKFAEQTETGEKEFSIDTEIEQTEEDTEEVTVGVDD